MNAAAEREVARRVDGLLDRIADDIAADAQRFAPVRTGELRDSIHVEREGDTVRVVAGADHAAYVELGTEDTPAQPFLRPALYRHRGAL